MVDMSKEWVYLIDVRKSCFSGSSVGYSFRLPFSFKPQMCPTLTILLRLHINAKTVGCFHFSSLHAALQDIGLGISTNASRTFAIESAL